MKRKEWFSSDITLKKKLSDPCVVRCTKRGDIRTFEITTNRRKLAKIKEVAYAGETLLKIHKWQKREHGNSKTPHISRIKTNQTIHDVGKHELHCQQSGPTLCQCNQLLSIGPYIVGASNILLHLINIY